MTWNPVTYWRAVRAFRQVEAEEDARIPPELRPPPGKWPATDGAGSVSVPLDRAVDRQEALKAICHQIGYEDRPEQPVIGWLALRRDEAGTERVTVLLGSQDVGFLEDGAAAGLKTRIEKEGEHGKTLWVWVFFGIDEGRYVAEVALPMAEDRHQG